jgi:hypothetical protein
MTAQRTRLTAIDGAPEFKRVGESKPSACVHARLTVLGPATEGEQRWTY